MISFLIDFNRIFPKRMGMMGNTFYGSCLTLLRLAMSIL